MLVAPCGLVRVATAPQSPPPARARGARKPPTPGPATQAAQQVNARLVCGDRTRQASLVSEAVAGMAVEWPQVLRMQLETFFSSLLDPILRSRPDQETVDDVDMPRALKRIQAKAPQCMGCWVHDRDLHMAWALSRCAARLRRSHARGRAARCCCMLRCHYARLGLLVVMWLGVAA